MRTLVLVEREKVTVQTITLLQSKGKGGKPLYSERERVMEADDFKKYFKGIYNLLVVAELSCDDWYFGRRTTLEYSVLRQGLFEVETEWEGENPIRNLFPILEEPYTSLRWWKDLPGNGMVDVIAYNQEAINNYSGFMWPNGRKACYIKKAF